MIWTILWILWGVAFVAIEGVALIERKAGATLSEHIWKWFAVRGSRGGGWTWKRVVLLAFLAWLLLHLGFGWLSL